MEQRPSQDEIDKICDALSAWFSSQGISIRVALLALMHELAGLLAYCEFEAGADEAHFEHALELGLQIIGAQARMVWKASELAAAEKAEKKQ